MFFFKKDLSKYVLTRIIKSIITISEDKLTLLFFFLFFLFYSNINHNIIRKLNTTLETDIMTYQIPIRSNVAISSAITSYARIHMRPFILHEGTIFTDTDSIFFFYTFRF